jgi:hypothetical protein
MRSLWFVAGAGVGVYAMVKARRAAEALTPEGLQDRLSALSVGAHLFADEVRTGMTEKETELRARLGLALDGAPELQTAQAPGSRGAALPSAPHPVTPQERQP